MWRKLLSMHEPTIELTIEPLSERYDPFDERWQDQATQLYRTLKQEVGGIRKEVARAEGDKGGVETIILALGSSGALVAAVEIFKAWISRDRERKLMVSYEVGGETRRIEVSGEGIDKNFFQDVARAAAGEPENQQWVTESTARS